MHPRIFDIHIPFTAVSIPVYSYGLMMMLGFLAGLYIARERARRESVDPVFIADLAMVLLLSGIVGARIAYLIEMHSEFSWQIFNVLDGGLSALGALLGGGACATLGYYLPVWRKQSDTTPAVIVSGIIGCVLGARVTHVAFHMDIYEGAFDIFKVYTGGLSFYGGLIAATAVGAWYIRKRGQDIPVVTDIMAPSIAIGLAFGRIGCFLNGCCFGRVTRSFLGMAFPGNTHGGGSPAWYHHHRMGLITFADPYSLPVHPTQIYHSLAALFIFVVLVMFYRCRRVPGRVFLAFGMLYALLRFLIEFLRGDMSRPLWGLTAYQVLAIPVFAACAAAFAYLPRTRSQN